MFFHYTTDLSSHNQTWIVTGQSLKFCLRKTACGQAQQQSLDPAKKESTPQRTALQWHLDGKDVNPLTMIYHHEAQHQQQSLATITRH